MTARSPPARPHIGIYPPSHFGRTNMDWGEDDVWDSASDSESPRQSTISHAWNRPSRATTSSTVRQNSSSSTLSSSYTHVNPPNPSSYPSREQAPVSRNGWTIIKKANENVHRSSKRSTELGRAMEEGNGDVDVDGDMVIGDMDVEPIPSDNSLSAPPPNKQKSPNVIRQDADAIVNDPFSGISRRPGRPGVLSTENRTLSNPERNEQLLREKSVRTNRRNKFVDCLSSQDVNIGELRKLAWGGIPSDLRPMAWQLLLGYLPLPAPLRASTLSRKRSEYQSLVEVTFARDREGLDQQIWHQIEIDVPRTRPGVRLWMHEATQRSLERILYVWALRHPASGYVQGINDLVTPFFQVFLSAYIDSDPEEFDPSSLPRHVLNAVEADSFWCLSRLLDGIQDNYIFAQPGIQRSVKRMAELVARIDAPLSNHLASQNVEFMQFAFRWMNCLLMREISVQNTIRMWDTYLAEGADAFSQFHLYVCSAFLVKWSEKLRQMDFQGIIMFLQSLPTQDWGDHEVEMLLSEAFVLNSIWHNAQSHFNRK